MNKTVEYKFSEIIRSSANIEFHIDDCSTPPPEINIYDPSRSDFFSILILLDGEATIKINLEERKIFKNTLIFLAPDSLKQLVQKNGETKMYKLFFTAKFLQQIGMQKHEIEMINFMSGNHGQVIPMDSAELNNVLRIIETLKEKYEHIKEHPYAEGIIHHTFQILLLEIGAISLKNNITLPQGSSRKRDLAVQFTNLLTQYYLEERSVKFYANKLSITPKYLNEVVHDVTGKSPGEIIDEKVMQEAKILLHNPRLSIAQIADLLHFSDQSFLGKFFKRHIGVSPSEYRNHNLGTSI